MAIAALQQAFKGIKQQKNVLMQKMTTFHIGGTADIVLYPESERELLRIAGACEEGNTPCYYLGNGSNVLVRDAGIRGVVVVLGGAFRSFVCAGNIVYAGASLSLNTLAYESVSSGLMGLEWAYGIPGTVGGACAMNAGAYGGEVKQSVAVLRVMEEGEIRDCVPERDAFSYRFSKYAAPGRIVLSARFRLTPDDGGAKERMEEYMRARKEKQPLHLPSAGSVFKRPPGHFAGALIEQAGLKGMQIGGAQISDVHAGFIVNTGGATADDVLRLMEHAQSAVLREFGVTLTPEIKIWG